MSTRDFAVSERPRVEVRLARGRLRFTSNHPGAIVISGLTDELEVTQTGDVITVTEPSGMRRSRSHDLTIAVPPTTAIDASVATAEVVCDAPVRELVVKSASGDVSASEVTAQARIRTASGDVSLETVGGDAEIATASGDARIGVVAGRLVWSTASGRLVVVRAAGGDAVARSASGDVTIERLLGSDLEVRTVSGDVRVGLPRGRRVDYRFKSLSGRVHLPQGGGETPGDGERQRVRLRVKSVSGDVVIRIVD